MFLVHVAIAQGWSCILPEGQCLFPCAMVSRASINNPWVSQIIYHENSWQSKQTNKTFEGGRNMWDWKSRDKEWDTCDKALPLSDLDHFWPLFLFLGMFQSHSPQSLYLHCFFCFSCLHSDDCSSLLWEMSGPWASKVHICKYFELLVKRC